MNCVIHDVQLVRHSLQIAGTHRKGRKEQVEVPAQPEARRPGHRPADTQADGPGCRQLPGLWLATDGEPRGFRDEGNKRWPREFWPATDDDDDDGERCQRFLRYDGCKHRLDLG